MIGNYTNVHYQSLLPINSDGRLDEVKLPTLPIYNTKTNNERERTKTKSGEADLRSKQTKNETSKKSVKVELTQSKVTICKTETNNESTRNKSGEAKQRSKEKKNEISETNKEIVKEISGDFIYNDNGEQMIFLLKEDRKFRCPSCEKCIVQIVSHVDSNKCDINQMIKDRKEFINQLNSYK